MVKTMRKQPRENKGGTLMSAGFRVDEVLAKQTDVRYVTQCTILEIPGPGGLDDNEHDDYFRS